MMELLLLSNSRAPGAEYLAHAIEEIAGMLDGRKQMLFIPYASSEPGKYLQNMQDSMTPLGVTVRSAPATGPELQAAIAAADSVFVGGGNTFRLLQRMRTLGALDPLRRRVQDGMPYMGASAGSNLACATIRTTNDMPIVHPGAFGALGLIPFQINPHYPYPGPADAHSGESREERLLQFLEENDVPVLGLREGTWLRVSGRVARLGGVAGCRLFRRGAGPAELAAGTDVSDLLDAAVRFDAGG